MTAKSEKNIKSQEQDLIIVNKILNGDINSFYVIQNKYKRIIATLIRKMIKDEDDVEDLTQETFIKAFNGMTKYQSSYSFSSWLYKIASNNCIDFLRKKRFNSVSINQPISNDSDELEEIEIKDSNYIPDITLMDNERKQILINAIENLPESYREIIKMRHGEDLDYNEISERLSMPLGTVKAHLFRARKILFAELNKRKYLFVE